MSVILEKDLSAKMPLNTDLKKRSKTLRVVNGILFMKITLSSQLRVVQLLAMILEMQQHLFLNSRLTIRHAQILASVRIFLI